MNTYQWYNNNKEINPDSVQQILAYGTLNDIKELRVTIGEDKLRDIFTKYPKKIYTPASLNFTKKFILNLQTTIDDGEYLKNTPRNTR
jgi:hypothetical protein